MNTILCLIGDSGAGKTTLAHYLSFIGVPEIISHTTRKPRTGEVDGFSYHFVSHSTFSQIPMVESVEYDHSQYGTSVSEVNDRLKESTTGVACIVCTYEGYQAIKNFFKDTYRVLSVFINTSPEIRRERMVKRGDMYEHIERRMAQNQNDKIALCDMQISNNGDFPTLHQHAKTLLQNIQRA